MRKTYLLYAILGGISTTLSAQSTQSLWAKIDSLTKQKKELLFALERINQQTEQYKLERVRADLKKYAQPICKADSEIVVHQGMTIGYNEAHEQANWVAHLITSDIREGTIGRTNDFRPDSLLKVKSAVLEDYWESGYDRGHLAPSADFRWSRNALSESYLYSNMSPQLPEFNREIWADVENLTRKWALDNQELYVVTGPILKKGLPTIGEQNKISIPEAFYKVLLDYKEPEVKAIGFLVPHKGMERNPKEFLVSVDSIERVTGIDFFPALPDDLEKVVEAQQDVSKWVKADTLPPAPVLVLEKGQVAASNAKHYVGRKCTVCGTVVSTRFNPTSKSQSTYINLDYTFPNQVFTIVIKGDDRVNFANLPEVYYKNKPICVKGEVELFNGTPQMYITHEKKIKLVEQDEEREERH